MKEYFSKFCKNLTWNYSESGHGKGAPDGVGGTWKRTADQLVAKGRDLATFKSLFDALKEKTTIKLFSVEDEEIRNIEQMILPDIKAFAGTMKCHQVSSANNSETLIMRRLSCFKCSPETKCGHYYLGRYNPGNTKKCILYYIILDLTHLI